MRRFLFSLILFLTACNNDSSVTSKVIEVDSSFQRIIYTSMSVLVDCPANADVWFIAGQSNASNDLVMDESLKTHYSGVYQYYAGRCYLGISPMYGTVGDGYNGFEQVAQDYVHRTGRPVIMAFFAIPGKDVAKFAPGGVYNQTMIKELTDLALHYRVDHFIWQQGEADSYLGTDYDTYLRLFNSLVSQIQPLVRNINVARSTLCTTNVYDSPTGRALDTLRSTYPGPNTDTISLNIPYRIDGCHFTDQGILELSRLWQVYLP